MSFFIAKATTAATLLAGSAASDFGEQLQHFTTRRGCEDIFQPACLPSNQKKHCTSGSIIDSSFKMFCVGFFGFTAAGKERRVPSDDEPSRVWPACTRPTPPGSTTKRWKRS